MRKKVWIPIALIVLIVSVISVAATSSKVIIESPDVVQAVAPEYSPLATIAKGTGDVLVDVTINSTGDVISAKSIEGHKLLQHSSEYAAKRWKFSPDSNNLVRKAQLIFSYLIP